MKKISPIKSLTGAAAGMLAHWQKRISEEMLSRAGVFLKEASAVRRAIWQRAKKFRMRSVVLAAIAIVVLSVTCWIILPPLFRAICIVFGRYYAALDIVKGSSFVVAMVALWIAWNNFRRGNTAIVKIVSVDHHGVQSLAVNNSQLFSKFEVQIKNLGIPLKNPSLGLTGFTRFGNSFLPLTQFKNDNPIATEGALEKGMIGSYGLRSFELDAAHRAFVNSLVDPDADGVSIAVYSNGFLIKRFFLRSRGWPRKATRRWNRFAYKVNERFQYTKIRWERPHLHCPTILPKLNDYYFALEEFNSALKELPVPSRNAVGGPLFSAPQPGDEPLFKRRA